MKGEGIIISKVNKTNRIFKFLTKIIRGVFIGYLIGGILLYLFQDKFIFMQQNIDKTTLNYLKLKNTQEINIKAQDGTNLHGWHIKSSDMIAPKLIIYFGGNAEEVSYMVDEVKRYKDWSVALVNYRGYGLSEGYPGEKNFYSDALEIYDYFKNQQGVEYSKVVVMGRSIGTGVATYLAQNRRVDGVLLVAPYDSLISVAEEMLPIYPVGIMVKHKFQSITRAPDIKVPLYIITATRDKTIPPWHSRKLGENWGGEVKFKEINGEDHNSMSNNEEYWQSIDEFLKGLTDGN